MIALSTLLTLCEEINHKIQSLTVSENFFNIEGEPPRGFEAYRQTIHDRLLDVPKDLHDRLNAEYFGDGPLQTWIEDTDITEILINRYDSIWLEKNGQLNRAEDQFLSARTYEHFLQRLYLTIGQEPSLTVPFVDASWNGHRLHITGPYMTDQPWVRLSIRKHQRAFWRLEDLHSLEWASVAQLNFLRKIIRDRANFLVIGATGSGKTSVLKALINECHQHERVLILEDSKEINPPNPASTHLLTRHDARQVMSTISLTDLVRQSLRMRPDRIIVGEVRGGEAKDLLMALATGHGGSGSTLHASDATQALIRLEMLIQMGAPNWNLLAIRRLIHLSLDYLVVCTREPTGHRSLEGIFKIVSLEESGLIIERVELD